MALQLKNFKPQVFKLLLISSRSSVTQAESARDNWKAWTENHVSLLHEVTQQQLAEAEKLFSNNATLLESLISKSQKLVFGSQHGSKKRTSDMTNEEAILPKEPTQQNSEVTGKTAPQLPDVLSIKQLGFDKLDRNLDGELLDKLFGIENESRNTTVSNVDITGAGMEQGLTDFWKSQIHTVELNNPTIQHLNSSLVGNASNFKQSDTVHMWALNNIPRNDHVCFSSPVGETSSPNPGSSTSNNKHKKPNQDQLFDTQTVLHEMMPKVLHQTPPSLYSVFTKDLIFENNFFSKSYVTVGITPYAMKILKYRILSGLMYSKREVHILKSTINEKEGFIRMRWRILALPSWKILLTPWKFTLFSFTKNISDQSRFFDGLSTFYVDGNGQIYKHRVDKLMPDEELDKIKIPKSLAELLKLSPKLSPSEATPTG